MSRLGCCPTLDSMLRIFELLVQNSDDVWLGLMRPNGGVGVRWGLTGGDLEGQGSWRNVGDRTVTFVFVILGRVTIPQCELPCSRVDISVEGKNTGKTILQINESVVCQMI
jgi:hypothetical protein